jgi:DNA polymerase-3 subunit gamma/tau
MSYQVIARKWRPQTFEDVVGQSATAQTLRNAILQNRIAHAYLFAGARGVGKTTTARILAKALNCAQGPTVTPCNICDSCKEIASGNSIDVLEIDAASNRGIDEIRELRENVKYAAARDRFKVFIIDEVHMLTTEAFNALLKTLEEPPPHVVFILATTELHKVPATILSRCQHFNFRAISYREILHHLQLIAREEQVRISEEALNAIARGSEGSMRDAQSLLDQVISFCGREVDDEAVRNLLGVIPQQILEDFTEAIAQSDCKRLILLIDQLAQSGGDLQQFVREMLSHLRNLLIIKIAGEDSQLIPVIPADLTRLAALAKQFSEEDLT